MSKKLRMPWGKYKNKQIIGLPPNYLRGVLNSLDEDKAIKLLGKQRYNLARKRAYKNG